MCSAIMKATHDTGRSRKAATAWLLFLFVTSAHAYTGRRFQRSGSNRGGSWSRHFPREAGQTFQINHGRRFASHSAPRTAPPAAAASRDPRSAEYVGNTAWPTPAGGGPSLVCREVHARVAYRKDRRQEDEWRSGEETLASGWGDCEDFAAAVRDRCREQGMPSAIYVVRAADLRRSHAVTIGVWGGRMWMSSNGDYREVSSLDHARNLVAADYGWQGHSVTIRKADGR